MEKILKRYWRVLSGISGVVLIIVATTLTALGQSTPGLSIAPLGTNGVFVKITNAIPAVSYELWWTPNLGDSADYPWTMAAAGGVGQTNFILPNWEYPSVFFRGLLDTNAIPLWEAAQPNNQAAGILTITIASPANGAVLQ